MSHELARGRVEHPRHSSEGNAALLVMVDSIGPYHHRSIVDETVLVALEHFGAPYRILDLGQGRPTAEALQGCSCLVIAQDGLGDRLTDEETRLISDSVRDGMGLVNFDWDLRRYHGPLLEVFGFEGVGHLPYATDLILVNDNGHYITQLQRPPAIHQAQRMVTGVMVKRWRDDVEPLAEALLGKDQLVYIRHLVPGNVFEPGHYPVVFAARWGSGRAVQYTLNPRLWRPAALGHIAGMDDVFWRSIVWAARKPFVANTIPPFVSMSFDDCSGRHDFRYLDVCTRHGYIPLVGLFLDNISEKDCGTLREKVEAGEIVINTHGGRDYYDRIYYEFGVGEHTEEAIREAFAWEDDFYGRLGIGPCRIVRGHFGEIGVKALPYLKERGRTLFCTPIHIGEHKADQFPADGYRPYNSLRCFYDYLPDDNGFWNFGSFSPRHLADFLTGASLWLRESPSNDIEKASDRAAEQLRIGLDNGFYAEVLTHEQKLSVLTLDEWDRILTRTDEKTSQYEKIFVSHEEIGDYIKSKDGSWIASAERGEQGLHLALSGRAEVPLRLSVFENVEDGVERRFVEAGTFDGKAELEA